MTTRIVVYAHRYKRPPKRKKPRVVELAATVVVHAPKPETDSKRPPHKAKPPPAAPPSRPPLPTIVVATNQ